ncbi:hybrid sensor histidine kinase/response regulator [Alteromonas sp. ASW11-130]|uniref:hybrid sensor histidine kinase/response regulator n=1 Tax=Alteromonas sp. ASW11-130 TaxID=3015775 RepID=UPI002241EEFE|nr:PAS domain-containing protein [Alteromonas sp. ASW11-130]MCW8092745.1 PAS domain-containing protein [Alteromonas sp. ASW11-130]
MSTSPFLVTDKFNDNAVDALMRTHDWSTSPLGHPDTWPQVLRTVTSLILNSKFPMFLAWGPQLALLYNDAYVNLLANKHPASLGRPFHEVWADIWEDITPIVEQAMAGQSTYHKDMPLTMTRKGYEESTWFTFSYSPIYDEIGNVGGMYCACTETTQEVLATRRRKNENEHLLQLFQQAPGIMAVLRDKEHVFELANEAYQKLVGNRELVGKTVREALPEVEGQGFLELLDSVYQSGEPYVGRGISVKLRQPDSDTLEQFYVDFVYQPIRDTNGEVSGIFIEGSDVTEAVKATQALRESEKHLRQLANTIPHLAWLAKPDGQITWFNDRWYEYTGTELEQVSGWKWQELHDPKHLPMVLSNYKRSLQSGEPFEMTFPLRSATGEYRSFFTRATPLRDDAGNILQWLGTNTDIHEIEMVQEELKRANRRKDEFLAMLAHELRNPLAPISTAAELLIQDSTKPSLVKHASDIISRQVGHMTGLVDDLLDVSRVTRGLVSLHMESVDIANVIDDAVEQVRTMIEQKQQRLTVLTGNNQCMVEGDRTRLTQVIANILNNASRYTPMEGHIQLHLAMDAKDIEITIKDDGIGIDAQLMPHIFDYFTQAERSPDRAQGGLGLGLALVKSLVKLHHGSVTAKSDGLGRGSLFTVRLPRASTAQKTDVKTTKQQSTDHLLDILIVDDNADAAQMLAMLLDLQGHRLRVEYRGLKALKQLEDVMPQVMVIDIGMPEMDGYELAQRIRALPEAAEVTLIALTGYGQCEDIKRSKLAGFDYHLVKPVDIQELSAILSSITGS